MNYIQHVLKQERKSGKRACGDVFLIERSKECTFAVLCDGIGSGLYANIAATTCASRLLQLAKGNLSTRAAAVLVANSMHRARKEDVPFTAFSIVKIVSDGHYTIHTYEAPVPIIVAGGIGYVPVLTTIEAGKEQINETSGYLHQGDGILFYSDGVPQAGLGRGYAMGLGEKRICVALNHLLNHKKNEAEICEDLMKLVYEKCGASWEDDTTLVYLKNRPACSLVVMTGPPSNPAMDREFVRTGMAKEGWKVVCGGSTADLVGRELGKTVKKGELGRTYNSVPEYHIDGLDVVSEGALVLNRVFNILEDDLEEIEEPNVVEKICKFMQQADDIEFLVGGAYNMAHETVTFKEIGVMPRHLIVYELEKKLKKMGKLVKIVHY